MEVVDHPTGGMMDRPTPPADRHHIAQLKRHTALAALAPRQRIIRAYLPTQGATRAWGFHYLLDRGRRRGFRRNSNHGFPLDDGDRRSLILVK